MTAFPFWKENFVFSISSAEKDSAVFSISARFSERFSAVSLFFAELQESFIP